MDPRNLLVPETFHDCLHVGPEYQFLFEHDAGQSTSKGRLCPRVKKVLLWKISVKRELTFGSGAGLPPDRK